jgi:hypothetical protein
MGHVIFLSFDTGVNSRGRGLGEDGGRIEMSAMPVRTGASRRNSNEQTLIEQTKQNGVKGCVSSHGRV